MILRAVAGWPFRRWAVVVLVGVFVGIRARMPTGDLLTQFFTTMTPTLRWDYPFWGPRQRESALPDR